MPPGSVVPAVRTSRTTHLALTSRIEIDTERRGVHEAEELYAESAAVFLLGRPAPYAGRLLFTPVEDGAAERGRRRSQVASRQLMGKAKDVVGLGDDGRR